MTKLPFDPESIQMQAIAPGDDRDAIARKVKAYVDQQMEGQQRNHEAWLLEVKAKYHETPAAPPPARSGRLAKWLRGLHLEDVTQRESALLRLAGVSLSILLSLWVLLLLVHFFLSGMLLPYAIWGKWLEPNALLYFLIGLAVVAPVLYGLWRFRDQNLRLQIENQRKEIHSQEFQTLCEQACGMHFPEYKEGDKSYERRKQAAINLQVAAIYQLQAYIECAYGKQFQRPAFLLLKSIWGGFVQAHESAWQAWLGRMPRTNVKNTKGPTHQAFEWREEANRIRTEMEQRFRAPLGLALQQVLIGDAGQRMRLLADDIPSEQWIGLNNELPGLEPLQWAGESLRAARLSGANLKNARLQGADLTEAQLRGADIRHARLQGAGLRNARLQGANMQFAQLQGANLGIAQLQGANLQVAELQGADLAYAQLQGADLRNSDLQGVNLEGARLQGADLRGVDFDVTTSRKGCRINQYTRFGRLPESQNSAIAMLLADDEDWREGDRIRNDWIAAGAVLEPSDQDNGTRHSVL